MPRPLLQGHQRGWSARALLAGRRSAWPRRSAAATRPLITAALAPLLSWLRPPPSPARRAREALVAELASAQPSRQRVDQLVDELLGTSEPFDEQLIGGGPWQVVYSRGPQLWKAWTSPGRLVGAGGNRASQDFQPRGRRVVNRGQVLGEAVVVTAEGTYDPQGDSARLPVLIKASVTSGALRVLGREVPLPIRGEGLVYLAYCDDSLRVFQNPGGAVSVQVREAALPGLLASAGAA